MMEGFSKIKNVIKKDGIFRTIKKVYKYMIAEYGNRINIFSRLYYKWNKSKYEEKIRDILNSNCERIIVYKNDLGWNIPLFQRPQHIAEKLANNGCLVLYYVTSMTDNVRDIKNVEKNLYLVNEKNRDIKKILFNELAKSDKNKYIDCYSTDYRTTVKELSEYVDCGFKVIYEYIDDMNPSIVGTDEIPRAMLEKYQYMLDNKNDVFIIVTADRLEEDVISKKDNKKIAMACNGVDYEHFKNIDNEYVLDEKFQSILKSKKYIIGYYGALASWMDYDLVRYLAENRPNYNIVFFGVKYDDAYKKSKIDEMKNVYFLGNKEYSILQNYATYFDVCTIPFKINEITNATSPVKLFEYMALEKPIVTTDMCECRKYKSVLIAKDKEQFVELIDKAVNLKDDNEYKKLLRKEALENTWDKKAQIVVNLLKQFE